MSLATRNSIAAIATLFYLSIGLWLLFAKTRLFSVSIEQQRIVGGLFILFSVYKGVMAYRNWSKQKQINVSDHEEGKN